VKQRSRAAEAVRDFSSISRSAARAFQEGYFGWCEGFRSGGFPMTTLVPFAATAKSGLRLHQETRGDVAARERLLDAAFGATRFEKTCERLRAGRLPARGLAFVAKDNGRVVGTVRLWSILAGGEPALLLGPLAVARNQEGLGLGSRLMRHALSEATRRGHKAVILVGDAPYYARFGFTRDLTENLVLPGPVDNDRFLGLELEDGALDNAFGLVIATGEKAARPKAAMRQAQIRRTA
jgi:predicted N-acetyltransferase YhbS